MKRLTAAAFSLLLALCALCSFAMAEGGDTPPLREGRDSIQIADGKGTVTLAIKEYGFSEDRTAFTVTVDGYNFLLSGKSGTVSEIMPFRIAIAWSPEEYLTSESFTITTEPVTTAVFRKDDGSALEEPLYILIAPKGKEINKGYFFVLSDGKFHSAAEFVSAAAAVDPAEHPEALRTVGAYVTFGRYEQDNNPDNGPEPIEWVVLASPKNGSRVLLLSRYGLDVKQYHPESEFVMWATCDLRTWLNGEFLDSAFTEEEAARIPQTEQDNSFKSHYSGYKYSYGGYNTKNTNDKVFLLSYSQAKAYFGLDYQKRNDHAWLRTAPTAYAAARGAETSGDAWSDEGLDAGRWWLRSPGKNTREGACVTPYGALSSADVRKENLIRPAIWLALEPELP